MRRVLLATALTALSVVDAAAQTTEARAEERIEIRLNSATGVRAFAPGREGEGMYLQDSNRQWYYARFFPRCHMSEFARDIRFITGDRRPFLTNGDQIVIGGVVQRVCNIEEVVRSGEPPTRPRRAFRPRPMGATAGRDRRW